MSANENAKTYLYGGFSVAQVLVILHMLHIIILIVLRISNLWSFYKFQSYGALCNILNWLTDYWKQLNKLLLFFCCLLYVCGKCFRIVTSEHEKNRKNTVSEYHANFKRK